MRATFTSSCFITRENKVLLIHHKLLDLWLPVGGELIAGETPLQGAYREAFEETGIHVEFRNKPGDPRGTPPGFIGYEEHTAGPKGMHMNFCFLGFAMMVEDRTDDLVPIKPGVIPTPKGDGSWSDYRWVTPEDSTMYSDLLMPPNVRDLLKLIAPLL